MNDLSERDWRRLIEAIRRRKCVLVTGPDVAFDPGDPHRVSLATQLAERLAATLPSSIPLSKDEELPRVAQLVYNDAGTDRYDLELEVQDFYQPFAEKTTAFHQELAAMPFTLCLTTTPDPFLFNAVQETPGKSPICEYYHYRKGRPTQLSAATENRPIIYSLFGHLQALDSLVLTETDLLEFLVNVVRAAPPLPAYITSQLADPQTSFLFLGFGFQRWYARVLLHVLHTYGHRNRSLALEGASFFEHPERQQTAVFFEQELKIEFRQHSWLDFAAELRKSFAKQAPEQAETEIAAGAAKVFLCHDSRDRARVVEVEQQLHQLGVNTWRDRQDLRGGEDWNRRIPQVIRKQVDYVLVLQTPHMLERAESYLHKEIYEALERQQLFDQSELFLIPALLEPNPGLERLAHLHQRELYEAGGVEQLATEIRADFHQRNSRTGGR